MIAALQHFRRPDVSVSGESVTVYSMSERVPVPLAMLHHPLCVTVAFFEAGEIVVVDPTLREQQVCEGEMVVTANRTGEVCQISKMGGVPAEAVGVLRAVEVAVGKVRELSEVVRKAVEEDGKRRNVGGMMEELRAENER